MLVPAGSCAGCLCQCHVARGLGLVTAAIVAAGGGSRLERGDADQHMKHSILFKNLEVSSSVPFVASSQKTKKAC